MNRTSALLLILLLVGGFTSTVQAQTVGPLIIEPNGSCTPASEGGPGGSGPRVSGDLGLPVVGGGNKEIVCLSDDELVCPEVEPLPLCAVAPILECLNEGTNPTLDPVCAIAQPLVSPIIACALSEEGPTSDECADLVAPVEPILACILEGEGGGLPPGFPVQVCANLGGTLEQVTDCADSRNPMSPACAALLAPAKPVLDCVQDGTADPPAAAAAPACAGIKQLGDAGVACVLTVPPNPMSPACTAFLGTPPAVLRSFLCTTGITNNAPAAIADMLCPKPTLAIVATTADAAEPSTPGLFTITRSNAPTTDALTVTFTVAGAAERPADYRLKKGEQVLGTTVTIDAGQASAAITVEVIDDGAQEVSESVIVDITPTAGFPAGAKTATVNIADDDTPSLSVTATPASPATVAEPSANGIFTLTRNSAELDRIVTFTTAGTATRGGVAPDYVLKRGEEVLDGSVYMGIGETSVTIMVEVVDDATVEPAETIVLDISSNTPAFPAGTKTASITIAASDAPTLVLTVAATAAAATESGTDGAFTITRSGAPTTDSLDVTFAVTGTATRGTDYTLMQGTTALAGTLVTIPAGASSTVVTVDVIDDPTPEVSPQVTAPTVTPGASPTNPPTVTPPGIALVQTETVILDISATTGTTGTGQKSATVTIMDNDPDVNAVLAGVDDCIVYVVEGDPAIYLPAGGRCYKFLTGRDPPPGCDDFIFAPNPVVCFVPPIPPQVLAVLCSNANAATQLRQFGYCIPPVRSVVLDPEDGIQVQEEGAVTDRFKVSLASQPTADTTVSFTALPAAQINDLTNLIFTTANWNVPQTVTVTPVQDRVDDGDNDVRIVITANGGGYAGVRSQVDVRVLDVDLVQIFPVGEAAVVEDGTIARLSIRRDSESLATARAVSFNLVGSFENDAAISARSLADGVCAESVVEVTGAGSARTVTIPSGCRSVELEFTTLIDGVAEPTETIVVTLQDPGTGIDVGLPGQQTVSILDNDVVVTVAAAEPADSTASETIEGTTPAPDAQPIPNVARLAIVLSQPSRAGGTPIEFSLSGSATSDDYAVSVSPGSFSGQTTVLVPELASRVTFTFTPRDDSIVEGDESIVLRVEPGTFYQVVATAQQTASLVDDDVVTPQSVPETAPAPEDATTQPPTEPPTEPVPESPPTVETAVVVPPASSESSSGLGEQPGIAPLIPLADAVAANREIVTKAVRIDGINTITWDLPAEPPAPIKGVQVWRSNSPYVLLATLPVGTPGFTEGAYEDAGAPASSRYLVTMYYGPTASDGLLDNSNAPQTTTYPGTATVGSTTTGAFALLFGSALALAAVATLGYAVVLRIRKEA